MKADKQKELETIKALAAKKLLEDEKAEEERKAAAAALSKRDLMINTEEEPEVKVAPNTSRKSVKNSTMI